MTKLIKLAKPSCNPCTMLGNLLEDLSVPHESYDVTVDFDIAMKYGAMSAPILLLTDDEGNEIDRISGFSPDKRHLVLDFIAKLG